MALLSLQGVTLNLGGKTLLSNVDLHIEAGERVCLTGRNGAGKSSLMALFGGDLQPDSGTVIRQPGVQPGYMRQAVPEGWKGLVFGITAAGLGEEGLTLAQAHQAVLQGNELPETGEAWDRHGEVMSVIRHLGLDPEAEFATLSGGGKRRVALARALIAADVLLLDEPTNHLDIHTISWLEDFLLRKAGTVLFISHDRVFAQRLATRVVEVDRGELHSYACTYDMFLERREARLEAEEQQAALFDKKLAREESWIRQGIKARRTRNMGRVRALEAMRAERAARRERTGNPVLHAQEAERSGKLVIEAENVSFTYPDGHHVLHNFSTVIQRGDRVGLVGNNGTGKTTLLRLLLGELEPSEGIIRHGTRLEISYFDQLRAALDPTKSVMHSVADGNDSVIVDGRQRHVAGYLKDFLFDSDRLRIPVSALSGGERNRLLLARLFTRPSNLLVLDEPTNDLDIETLELLEDRLTTYSGTILVVSHDRMFLDNIVTATLALEGDNLVREYVGGYTDWLRQRGTPTFGEKTENRPQPRRVPRPDEPRRLSYKEQREQQELQKELHQLPEALTALEQEQVRLEATLADPDLFNRDSAAFHAAVARRQAVEDEQLTLLERYEAVEARLAELARQAGPAV